MLDLINSLYKRKCFNQNQNIFYKTETLQSKPNILYLARVSLVFVYLVFYKFIFEKTKFLKIKKF